MPGARYTFALVVTNFLGARSSVATLAIAKSLSPAPLVAVQGAAARTTTRSLGVALVAASELPNVACGAGATGAGALDSLALRYRWALLSSERDDGATAADDGGGDDDAAASLAFAAAEESTTRLTVAGGVLAAHDVHVRGRRVHEAGPVAQRERGRLRARATGERASVVRRIAGGRGGVVRKD